MHAVLTMHSEEGMRESGDGLLGQGDAEEVNEYLEERGIREN